MALDTPVRDTAELPRLLSVRELAAYLDVPPSTVYLWRSEGRGPKGFRVGKQVRFRASEVEAWLEEQAARASSP
jgi:excisionase family DNA binding protein